MADKRRAKGDEGRQRVQVNLEGLKRDEERPVIAVTLVGDDAKPILVAQVDADGTVDVPAAALKKASRVLIGPVAENPADVDPATILRYRPSQFGDLIGGGALNLPRPVWEKWWFWLRCVTGTVKLCRRSPWWFEELFELAVKQPVLKQLQPAPTAFEAFEARPQLEASLARASFASRVESKLATKIGVAKSLPELVNFPFRCQTICNGTVEVYRRTCCCEPWIIEDPRFDDLFHELEDIVTGLGRIGPFPPNPPFPPDPNPPDPPYLEPHFFKEGALDEKALNATADLHALRALPRERLADYVNARSYLRCWRYSCGAPTKIASGAINADGRFSICWFEGPRIPPFPCQEEYAYIVKQKFGVFSLTVYNGVAANIWFNGSTDANLVTYSPWAYACRDNGDPGTGAFVLLDLIGDTESWNLKTPNSTGWDRVAAPGDSDGLAYPAASLAAAIGQNLNRNWGGTLKLNYLFSEDMRPAPVGAKYYRIGVAAATAGTGDPIAAPDYLSDGLSWDKIVNDPILGNITVPVTLGPFTVGTQNSLFLIPYDRNDDGTTNEWTAGQYHGYLDTTKLLWSDPTKRHLITVEVFDAAGARLRPTGTTASGAPGAEVAKPFTFRRRVTHLGPNPEVPFAALTHMFWWDNRDMTAEIDWLNKDGLVFSEECLFLLGTPLSTLGIAYRAFHPEERFQLVHTITWRRGIGGFAGSTGSLQAPASNNVGVAGPEDSGVNTFAEMLRTDLVASRKKCAFTVFLNTSAKTTDGDNFGNPSIQRTGAFAIEIN